MENLEKYFDKMKILQKKLTQFKMIKRNLHLGCVVPDGKFIGHFAKLPILRLFSVCSTHYYRKAITFALFTGASFVDQ